MPKNRHMLFWCWNCTILPRALTEIGRNEKNILNSILNHEPVKLSPVICQSKLSSVSSVLRGDQQHGQAQVKWSNLRERGQVVHIGNGEGRSRVQRRSSICRDLQRVHGNMSEWLASPIHGQTLPPKRNRGVD